MSAKPLTVVDGLGRERCSNTWKFIADCRCEVHREKKKKTTIPTAHATYNKPKSYRTARTSDFEIPFGTPIPKVGDEMDVVNPTNDEKMHIRIKEVHSVEWLDDTQDRGVRVDITYEILATDLRVRLAEERVH